MKKKKKQQKTFSEGIPLSPDEQVRMDTLLKDLDRIEADRIGEWITSPGMAFALLDRLPWDTPRALDLIPAIRRTFGQKDVQKALKKTIFKLKQKGIEVPEDKAERGASILTVKAEPVTPEARLGPVDGGGSRPLFVAVPRLPVGYQVGLGIVNDEQGITDFMFGDYSKKRMREIRDLFSQNFTAMIETSFVHAATVLEKAYSLNPSGSDQSLRQYRRLRPYIQDKTTLLDHPPVYDHIPHDSVARDALTGSQIDALFAHDLLSSWLFDLEKMETLVKAMKEAEESPILVSRDQKGNRIKELKEKAIADHYTDARRLLLKGRLEETAYFFLKLGEESPARSCLLAALSLEQQSSLMGANPFLMAILDRTLDLYWATTGGQSKPLSDKEDKDKGSSIIMP